LNDKMNESADTGNPAAAGTVYRSAALAIAIAWSMRLIGLISVLVLARVLTPRDFGIVALAMSVLAIVDIFSALGLRQSLLRIARPERAHYDTAWSIQFLVLIALFVVLVAVAPLAAWFYREPALSVVIAVLASRFLFYGLVNIGIVDFDRHLQLGRDLRMRVGVRLATFVVTLASALALQNYWALVIGSVTQSVFHAAASYIVHPFRPRFSLAKRAELLGVSLWMFLASAAQTVQNEVERTVVGRIATMNVLGFYAVSKDLSSIFTNEIATALNRVTFVTTARTGQPLSADPNRLAAMLGSYALLTAPLGLGLTAAAQEAVSVLLGPQWTGAAQFLSIIAPTCSIYAVYKLLVSTLQASGDARLAAFLSTAGAATMILGATVVVLSGGGAIWLAYAALMSTVLLLWAGIILCARKAHTSALTLSMAVARPFLAAVLMMLVLRGFDAGNLLPIAALAVKVAAGAALFALFVSAIWVASGRLEGAEMTAGSVIKHRYGKLRNNRLA
jgi:lipopolysaccharide exporter